MFKTLYIVTEHYGAELPVLVTEDIKEVSRFIGKPLATTRWYFSPSAKRRRADKNLFTKNLYVPYKFEKVRVNMEDD